jgi:hypothetical protein
MEMLGVPNFSRCPGDAAEYRIPAFAAPWGLVSVLRFHLARFHYFTSWRPLSGRRRPWRIR